MLKNGHLLLKYGVIRGLETKMFDSLSPQFRAARIDSGLQERLLGARAAAAQYQHFAFFLDSGQALAQTRTGEFELSGPAVHWGRLSSDTRVRLAAGSTGYYIFLGDQVLEDAIGTVAEAAELRLFAEQQVVAAFDRGDAMVARFDLLFSRVVEEAGQVQFGTEIAVSAYLRLLLVLIWRSADRDEGVPEVTGHGRGQINRFRALVESHFRARWPARKYAAALGMSYDRLHDLCVRSVGKPPALLIRERCLHEAQVLLQRTSLSAERISAMLGFSSASQFNHFFKSMAKETPGAFRKRMLVRGDRSDEALPRFSDWP
jgi:AraC family transcriptional activator of pobA